MRFFALPDIPMIQTGDDLSEILLQSCQKAQIELQDGDVLVLAQKIVSKAEGRWVNLAEVTPGQEAQALAAETEKDPRLLEMILRESRQVVRKRPGLVITEHNLGFISANAGIDHSNVMGSEDWVLLLPEDPSASAERIRTRLEQSSGAKIGVLIIDSHGRAWRNGTVGITIGLSGVPGVVDRRGELDLFGYEMRATIVGAADELAAGASLLMGQVDEATPAVLVRGFPYALREAQFTELIRDAEHDLFR
ncbi:coenzyme F420-0:L-glutamate ligase [bacterium]|nr:coenzyme F420-0:L-glutamate ligase [bacterium]MCB2179388.1 coenzyme F420-0:L-glutamate ligase [bacterium]